MRAAPKRVLPPLLEFGHKGAACPLDPQLLAQSQTFAFDFISAQTCYAIHRIYI